MAHPGRALWFLLGFVGFAGIALAAEGPVNEGRSLFVEGYAGRVSYLPGEELALHVSKIGRAHV